MIAFEHKTTKGRRFPVEILTRDEIDALLGSFSKRGSAGIRDRAMTCLLWRCGLRISEALALRPKDIDETKGTVTVLLGKGKKRRVVGVDAGALAVLELWMQRRKSLGVTSKSTVFCKLDGGRVSTTAARAAVHRAAHRAGLEKRVHPHALRHCFASELRSENVDLGEISTALGHSSVATTSRYVEHLCPQKSIDTVKARSW